MHKNALKEKAFATRVIIISNCLLTLERADMPIVEYQVVCHICELTSLQQSKAGWFANK
jgi:hypothetical protein